MERGGPTYTCNWHSVNETALYTVIKAFDSVQLALPSSSSKYIELFYISLRSGCSAQSEMWLIKPTIHWNMISTRYKWIVGCRQKTAHALRRGSFLFTIFLANIWLVYTMLIPSNGKLWKQFVTILQKHFDNENYCTTVTGEKQGELCSRCCCHSLLGKCRPMNRQFLHFSDK